MFQSANDVHTIIKKLPLVDLLVKTEIISDAKEKLAKFQNQWSRNLYTNQK